MIESPAYIVRQHLSDQVLVSLPSDGGSWPMFVGHITDVQRDDVCAVYDTTPLKDGRIHRTGEVILHHGIQVKTRAVEYETGWSQDDRMQRDLCAVHNVSVIIGLREWQILNLTKASAAFVGVDEMRRNVFVANFIVSVRSLN